MGINQLVVLLKNTIRPRYFSNTANFETHHIGIIIPMELTKYKTNAIVFVIDSMMALILLCI